MAKDDGHAVRRQPTSDGVERLMTAPFVNREKFLAGTLTALREFKQVKGRGSPAAAAQCIQRRVGFRQ